MNIVLQLLKEFWLPLSLSVLWVAYNVYSGSGEAWDAKRVVNIFGPTFFLLSWVTGQFFRVKKQVKVEGSLDVMEKRLERLLEELEKKTKDVIDHVSGGDSFPWIQVAMVDDATDKGILMVNHCGKHPLYDVGVRIVDLNKFTKVSGNFSLKAMQITDTNINIGNLISGYSSMPMEWQVAHTPEQDYNAFFTARNGGFTQSIRMKKVGKEWLTATRVTNMKNEVVYEHVDAQFPHDKDGMVSWK